MTEFKQYLREYAERELELIGFMNTEFGSTCIKFLEDLSDIAGNDPESMKAVCEMLPRLIDRHPLSAITEQDFETEIHAEGSSSTEILRCTRYPYLYKKNDRYWDDRAVAFQKKDSHPNSKIYLYQTDKSSKQEVELPYFPHEQIVKL